MWKVIPTYTDLREYDALIKRWYDMVSTIYDTHQANVLKIRRNRQDLFTPEGHLQETEQRKSGLIYDYVKAVWKFLEANREGINLDMKSKKAILQSSISSFKILEQDFKNREILRSAKDYKKQEDIDADISRVSQFNELPGQGVIDQEDIDSSNRVKLTPAQHRQAREDKEALYDKVVPDLNEVVDFYISLDREGKDRLQIDNLIREQLQDVTEGRNPDVSDPYIRVLLLTYLHYKQRYGIVPDIDVDSEMWNNALIATTNYLYQNAPHAYDPGSPETQYPDAVDGEFDLGDTAQEVIDRINRAPAGVGRGRPRKVGRPRGSKNKKY
jgi:hypothetical protein